MSGIGFAELLVMASMVVFPCIGLLIVGGILLVVVALTKKARQEKR